MNRIFEYTRERIVELILKDIQEQHGLELTPEQVLVFTNNQHTFTISIPEIIEESNHEEMEQEEAVSEELDEDVSQTFREENSTPSNAEQTVTERTPSLHYQNNPPYTDTREYQQIRRLLEWAVENKAMLEIVYNKRRGGQNERTARIITPLFIDGNYLRTMLHVTLRNGEVEFTTADDNLRTFAIGLIERARISDFNNMQ